MRLIPHKTIAKSIAYCHDTRRLALFFNTKDQRL
jgi:hypothetical protein